MADSYTPMPNGSQGIFAEKTSAMQDECLGILPEHEQQAMSPTDPTPIGALSQYVRQVMTDYGLTVYSVEREARRRGGTLGKSTVDGIVQGTIKNPGIYTLRELAWGLRRPVEEVIAIALGAPLTEKTGFKKSDVANLWEMYTQIDKPDRHFFDRVWEMCDREMRRLLSG